MWIHTYVLNSQRWERWIRDCNVTVPHKECFLLSLSMVRHMYTLAKQNKQKTKQTPRRPEGGIVVQVLDSHMAYCSESQIPWLETHQTCVHVCPKIPQREWIRNCGMYISGSGKISHFPPYQFSLLSKPMCPMAKKLKTTWVPLYLCALSKTAYSLLVKTIL